MKFLFGKSVEIGLYFTGFYLRRACYNQEGWRDSLHVESVYGRIVFYKLKLRNFQTEPDTIRLMNAYGYDFYTDLPFLGRRFVISA